MPVPATDVRREAPRLVVPSRRKGDTIVVSMANWAPWQVRDEHVRRDPGTCFPAHLCRRTFQRIAFFLTQMKEKMQSVSHKIEEPPATEVNHSANVAPIALHVKRLRDVTISATTSTETQQGTRESTTSSTRQKSGPTVPPCQFHPSAQDGWFRTGLGFGQQPHKRACFLRPPATHFSAKERQGETGNGGQQVPDKVRSFRRRAACNATPSMWAIPGRAAPSQWSGLTNVASMASCMPPNSGRPSATTSNRRLSSACGANSGPDREP